MEYTQATCIPTGAFQFWLCRSVQVWNPRSGVCTGTIDTGYGLSLLWAPGNRHVVVGTKVILLRSCADLHCTLEASRRISWPAN